jgi:hypothetical protein
MYVDKSILSFRERRASFDIGWSGSGSGLGFGGESGFGLVCWVVEHVFVCFGRSLTRVHAGLLGQSMYGRLWSDTLRRR